jgi:hypothetical protein
MKMFITVLLSFFLVKSCVPYKSLRQTEIQYVAESRGYYYAIKIKGEKFFVCNARNDDPTEVSLKKSEWKLLINLYNDIDLTTFKKLKGATNERRYDKRPFGNLFITDNGEKIETKGFDHTIPPKEIKPFIDLILRYSKK